MIVVVRRVHWEFEEIAHWQRGELTYNRDFVFPDPLYDIDTASDFCDRYDGPNIYAVQHTDWDSETNQINSPRGKFTVPKTNQDGFHLDLTPRGTERDVTIHVAATEQAIRRMKRLLYERLLDSSTPLLEIPFNDVSSLTVRLELFLDGTDYTAMSAGTAGDPDRSPSDRLILHVTRNVAADLHQYCDSHPDADVPYRRELPPEAAIDFLNGVKLSGAPLSDENHQPLRPSVAEPPTGAPVQAVLSELPKRNDHQQSTEGAWVYYYGPKSEGGWQNMDTGEVSHRKQRPGPPPDGGDGYSNWLPGWSPPPDTITSLSPGQLLEVQLGDRDPVLAVVMDTADDQVSVRTEYPDDLFESDHDLSILAVENVSDSPLDDVPPWMEPYRDS